MFVNLRRIFLIRWYQSTARDSSRNGERRKLSSDCYYAAISAQRKGDMIGVEVPRVRTFTFTATKSSHYPCGRPEQQEHVQANCSTSIIKIGVVSLFSDDESTVAPSVGFYNLANTKLPWDERFALLVDYRNRIGHCSVPQVRQFCDMIISFIFRSMILLWVWSGSSVAGVSQWHLRVSLLQKHPLLGSWVNDQRTNYKRWIRGERSILTEDRCRALEYIGFVWNPNDAIWSLRLEELKAFRARTGHFNVPQKRTALGKWVSMLGLVFWGFTCKFIELFSKLYVSSNSIILKVNDQRTRFNKLKQGHQSNLTKERRQSLNEIGFTWNAKEANWYERLEELKVFQQKNGHTRVPIRDSKLGRWVDKQRTEFRRSYLSEERKAQLDDLDFVWDLRPKRWTAL